MIITNLGSGSKGNSTLIETDSLNILIDAGLSFAKLEKRLRRSFPKIDVLVLTHTHKDHIQSINKIITKYKPIFITIENDKESKLSLYNDICYDKKIVIKDIEIETLKLSHDVPCIGLIIKEDEKELVYITDTGYIKEKTLDKITNKDMYIIESNYDEEMLSKGSYPFYLKQRIRSPRGHLSNDDTLRYLKKIIGPRTKYINLAHLSEENNDPILVASNMKKLRKEVKNNIKEIKIYSQEEINVTNL